MVQIFKILKTFFEIIGKKIIRDFFYLECFSFNYSSNQIFDLLKYENNFHNLENCLLDSY